MKEVQSINRLKCIILPYFKCILSIYTLYNIHAKVFIYFSIVIKSWYELCSTVGENNIGAIKMSIFCNIAIEILDFSLFLPVE